MTQALIPPSRPNSLVQFFCTTRETLRTGGLQEGIVETDGTPEKLPIIVGVTLPTAYFQFMPSTTEGFATLKPLENLKLSRVEPGSPSGFRRLSSTDGGNLKTKVNYVRTALSASQLKQLLTNATEDAKTNNHTIHQAVAKAAIQLPSQKLSWNA